jgi:hypothetical protein
MQDQPFIQDKLTAHIDREGLTCGDIHAYAVVVRESAHAASPHSGEKWWRRAGRVACYVKCFIYTHPEHGNLWELIRDDLRAQQAVMHRNESSISPLAAYIKPHVSYHKRAADCTGRPFSH